MMLRKKISGFGAERAQNNTQNGLRRRKWLIFFVLLLCAVGYAAILDRTRRRDRLSTISTLVGSTKTWNLMSGCYLWRSQDTILMLDGQPDQDWHVSEFDLIKH